MKKVILIALTVMCAYNYSNSINEISSRGIKRHTFGHDELFMNSKEHKDKEKEAKEKEAKDKIAKQKELSEKLRNLAKQAKERFEAEQAKRKKDRAKMIDKSKKPKDNKGKEDKMFNNLAKRIKDRIEDATLRKIYIDAPSSKNIYHKNDSTPECPETPYL